MIPNPFHFKNLLNGLYFNYFKEQFIHFYGTVEKKGYFINKLNPGEECVIEISKKDGSKIYFVTLTEEQSDHIWKGNMNGKEFVAITNSSLIYDNDNITLIDDEPSVKVLML